MAENPKLAFLQRALSVNGANAPVEETALENLVFQRLITAGMTIDSSGNITAPFVTATPNVTNATGTLPVTHGGTGVTTLTGLVKGNGAAVMTTVTAPSGAVVGDTDAQTLTNKTISGASNTLTVRAASDITGTLPHANGGTDSTHFTVTGPSVDRSYAFPDASTTVLTTNALITVPQGGTGLATLTANNVILGNGASTPAFVAPSTSGNLLTSNGTTWASTAPAAQQLVLLKNGNGTSTAGVATTVDSIAITGLTTKDTLVVYYTIESVTADTALTFLRNETDGVALQTLCASGGVVTAGSTFMGTATIAPRQGSTTLIVCQSSGWGTLAAAAIADGRRQTFTTLWTGSWTLGLRHSGVTATGTFSYTWSVYAVRGQ